MEETVIGLRRGVVLDPPQVTQSQQYSPAFIQLKHNPGNILNS